MAKEDFPTDEKTMAKLAAAGISQDEMIKNPTKAKDPKPTKTSEQVETPTPVESKTKGKKRRQREYEIVDSMVYSAQPLMIPDEIKKDFLSRGLSLRWVRVKDTKGAFDKKNVLNRHRQGYQFVYMDELPLDWAQYFDEETYEELDFTDGMVTYNEMALAATRVENVQKRREMNSALANGDKSLDALGKVGSNEFTQKYDAGSSSKVEVGNGRNIGFNSLD